jgi:hypothetical protein
MQLGGLEHPQLEMASWSAFWKSVPKLLHDEKAKPVMTLISENTDITPFIIRRGDVGLGSDEDDELRHQVSWDYTLLATLLMYLRNSTCGVDWTGDRRYKRYPKDATDCFFGYHVDDWFRAWIHYMLFVLRRNDKKKNLDGKSGPSGQMVDTVFQFRLTDSKSLLGEEHHTAVPINAMATGTMLTSNLIAAARNAIEYEKDSLATRLANFRSGDFDINAFRRTLLSMSYNQLAPIRTLDKDADDVKVTDDDIPPLDRMCLQAVVNHQYHRDRDPALGGKLPAQHREPVETCINHDFDEATAKMFDAGKGLNDFMGAMEPLIRDMAMDNPDQVLS